MSEQNIASLCIKRSGKFSLLVAGPQASAPWDELQKQGLQLEGAERVLSVRGLAFSSAFPSSGWLLPWLVTGPCRSLGRRSPAASACREGRHLGTRGDDAVPQEQDLCWASGPQWEALFSFIYFGGGMCFLNREHVVEFEFCRVSSFILTTSLPFPLRPAQLMSKKHKLQSQRCPRPRPRLQAQSSRR